MKAKTIRRILDAKVKDWAESITDPMVKSHILQNTIITGGSIASMLLKEPVNDYDVYFRTKESALKVAEYYCKKFIEQKDPKIKPEVVCTDEGLIKIVIKSAGIAGEDTDDTQYQYFETLPEDNIESTNYVEPIELETTDLIKPTKTPYEPVFLSSNAITLSNQVQCIIRFFGEPDEIHENYDFSHCTSWWSSWDCKLVLRPEAMEALLARELRYQGSKYPLCSIIRTRKFIKRGFTINAGQYLKMCMQLNALDLCDVKVLEDQLTGVDVAYFYQIINYIKKSNKQFDAAYICEIVDRIF